MTIKLVIAVFLIAAILVFAHFGDRKNQDDAVHQQSRNDTGR